MTRSWNKLYPSLFAAVVAVGCSLPRDRVERVELLVLPTMYVVDGIDFQTPNDAVAAVLAKQPLTVALPACGAMATKRVAAATELLRANFGGTITMSVLGDGERGCPGYSS